MRFRLTRFYRAYPELNDHSDDECEHLLSQAHARRGDVMWMIPLALIGLMALLAGPLVYLGGMLLGSMTRTTTAAAKEALVLSYGGLAAIALLIGAIAIWVATRRALAIRSVLNHLEKARCPYCLFSLTGLKIELGAVTCPECGQRIILADEGIHPDNLLPKQTRAHQTWKPGRGEAVELPPIPLEPESPKPRPKAVRSFGVRKGDGEGKA